MPEIENLYPILKKMLENAVKGNKLMVMRLNNDYEDVIPYGYHYPPRKLELDYDNCRHSCVMSVNAPFMQKQFVSDARERFSRIPKPKAPNRNY